MDLLVATTLVNAFYVYSGVGALFALAFVTRGAAVIDGKAREGTFGFRLLLVPGAIALWPWLTALWIAALWLSRRRA